MACPPRECTVRGASQDLACGTEGKELLLQKGRKLIFLLHVAGLQNPLVQKQKALDAFNGMWRGGGSEGCGTPRPSLPPSWTAPAAGFIPRNFFFISVKQILNDPPEAWKEQGSYCVYDSTIMQSHFLSHLRT